MNENLELDFKPITLLDARRNMMEKVRAGFDERCPCCTRLVKLYKRKIHAEMVLWLAGLWKLTRQARTMKADETYFTTLEILRVTPHLKAGGTNGTLLVHWGLIEKIPDENRGGAPAGSYRITQKGVDFLQGLKVPAQVHFICGEIVGFSEELTDVVKALGKKFDYADLMAGL